MTLVKGTYESPLGRLTFFLRGTSLVSLEFASEGAVESSIRAIVDDDATRPIVDDAGDESAKRLVDRLARYFGGDTKALDDVETDAHGTAFQKRVWAALREIPAGETRAYVDIARRLGDEAAVRAVGAANGKNPIAIVVPCHRVIGKDGTLTGYAGGLSRKRWLLEHERAQMRLPMGATSIPV